MGVCVTHLDHMSEELRERQATWLGLGFGLGFGSGLGSGLGLGIRLGLEP